MIIERASGISYETYLHERIFAPLGMAQTRFNNSRALVPGRATGYYSLGTAFRNVSLHSPTIAFGSSGIFSTAGDLLIWDQALHSDRVISRTSREAMFTPFLNDYAYGLRVCESFGRSQVNHSGSSQGFSSFMVRFVNENVTVIVLSNSDEANASRVGMALAAIYFEAPYDLPAPSLHDVLWDAIAAEGVDASRQRYLDLERTQPSAYNFAEDETLVDLGYSLVEANRLAEAQAIFAFTIERFPRSAYSYDGLADIAARRGDFATAIGHFQTSLELDPDNEYAERGLTRARQGRRMH
jgi:CubicO group peptidase (beta-lactamase class C family)